MFNDLDGVLEIVRSWGINNAQIDEMLRRAYARGLADFIKKNEGNPNVAPVVVQFLHDMKSTVANALALGGCHQVNGWSGFFQPNHLFSQFANFSPDRASLRIVDFGNQSNVSIQTLQSDALRLKLAGLEVLFALSQHPRWRVHGPSTLAAGIRITPTSEKLPRSSEDFPRHVYSPLVWHPSLLHGEMLVDVRRVDDSFPRYCVPVRLF